MSTINRISQIQSDLAAEAPTRAKQTTQDQTQTAPTHVKVQASAPTRRDQADISPTSVLLSQALSLPDVRTDKVAKIQQALAAGTYHVSSADLADKLITTLQRS